MKTFLTMTLVVVLGVALTTTISFARLGMPLHWTLPTLDLPAEADTGELATSGPTASTTPESGAKPVAVAEETEFDFGHLRNKTFDNRHVFKVRNDGTAPLEITGSSVSCTKCTFVDLPDTAIAPGATGEVVVRWNVDTFEDHFRQSAKVKTNDPDHEELRFVISGQVVRPLKSEPQKLVFSNVQVGEQAQVKLRLSAYFSDHLEVVGHSLADASAAEYFDISTAALAKDQLEPEVESGVEVTVTAKPGLPVGALNQTLKLKTNLDEEPEIEIPISGEVVGAVTVSHKDWDREYSFLNIGQVKQSEGAKRTLRLVVRGTDLSGLELQPAEIDDPEALKVTYGKPVELKAGAVVLVPVTIEIPPGCPLVSHMGGKDKLAQIVIPTNKSALGRVKLSVKFAVIAD